MDDELAIEQRKERLKKWAQEKKVVRYLPYIILAFLMLVGYLIRIANLKHLMDVTTGKHIPLALDPFVFLRYAREILENGALSAVDTMRYHPWGYQQVGEFGLLSNVIVGFYKFIHLFNSSVTLEYIHVIYPPIFFSLSLIFFYLLVKRLFDYRVGLLATAFLVVLPSYLYRTLAGFSDKESLAMFFMFAAIYFYVRALQEDKLKFAIICGAIAGLASGLMGATWGGVQFLFIIFGMFALSGIFLDRFSKKDLWVYFSWIVTMLVVLNIFFSSRYNLFALIGDVLNSIMLLAFLAGIIYLLIKNKNIFGLKEKIRDKIPTGLFSIVLSIVLGLIGIIVFEGFSKILERLDLIVYYLTKPFGNRWILTVAESHQPYVKDWLASWGWLYLILMILGSIFLVYNLLKKTKIKWTGTIFYSLFILSFIFSRYKANSLLNGENLISKVLNLGSLLALIFALVALYLYSYKKNKDLHSSILKLDKTLLFVIIWFIVTTVAARSAIRLLHLYSPVTTIFVAYSFVWVFDYIRKLDKEKLKYVKFAGYAVLVLLLVLPNVHGTLFNLYTITSSQAQHTGPSYNVQWQYAMEWVRDNTDEDAVFAHWWDYGYWVQTGGERTTLTDGGNFKAYALNHNMGRHVLTARNETEALEYLYARNATHLLMINDEIGKYPAFSSIGSDVNYDRYSWITTFQLDNSKVKERRNDTLLFYAGSYAFDDDLIFEDKLFPKGSSGIAGFFMPVTIAGENNAVTINQPTGVVIHEGKQYNVPLECVFVNGVELEFDQKGLDGCLLLIPRIVNNKMESPIGGAIYLSERVRNSLFAHLFLYGAESDYFKLVYTDQENTPLALYGGRLIGPLKIWEVSYPEGLQPSEWYYKRDELPDPDVRKI